MAAAATHSKSKREPERSVDPVDPTVLAAVGDVARPRGIIALNHDLDHLPGRTGWVAGVEGVVGMVRHGEAHFASLIGKYGPVFKHMMGLDPVVLLADPDHIWTLARNDDRVWSAALAWGHYFGGLYPSETSDGLLNLDFELHRDARRLLQPAFGGPAIGGYVESARPLFAEAIDGWMRRSRIRFKAEVRRLFARVSAKIFMGIDDPAEAEMLDRAMTDGWQAILALRRRTRWGLGWRRAQRGLDTLWATLRPRMESRRGGSGTDLLSRLCQTRDEATWLDDDDTRMRLFIGMMFGAFDTTASGTASMAYLLARNPTWQERLRDEAQALEDEAPTPEALKTLERQEWVWKETLRLYPVAAVLSRVTLREVNVGGARIPAGTLVSGLTGAASRDPKWWTDPLRFDPERFSPERAEDKRHKATYLPFGAGAHSCVGAQLAGVEVKAFWHQLLRRGRLRLAKDYEARHCYTPIGIVSGDVEVIFEPLV
jgi:cytochrome P450